MLPPTSLFHRRTSARRSAQTLKLRPSRSLRPQAPKIPAYCAISFPFSSAASSRVREAYRGDLVRGSLRQGSPSTIPMRERNVSPLLAALVLYLTTTVRTCQAFL